MARRVLIIHGHAESREVLAELLSQNFELVAALEGTRGLEKQISELTPEVVVLDVDHPGAAGIDGVKRLAEWFPDLAIVALSSLSDTVHVREIMTAGAAGYVLKTRAVADLARAVNEVAQGGTFVSVLGE